MASWALTRTKLLHKAKQKGWRSSEPQLDG
jgi:hypothetical protein